jgi:predicted lipoprotein with Yx(FWY)xxD motif
MRLSGSPVATERRVQRAAAFRRLTPLSGLVAAPSTRTGPAPATSSAPAARSTHRARARITVRTADSRYGRVLVDARGRTLYLFTRDGTGASRCDGACARAWPPYVVAGGGRAGAGGHTSLIGIIRRKEGSRQLTYNGHPLYYYVGDRAPGDILCQDVEEYGGHWWVVSPAGGPVTGSGTPCGRSR